MDKMRFEIFDMTSENIEKRRVVPQLRHRDAGRKRQAQAQDQF